jgi:NNP family nitrate/nitrite transporter-like MFS transporter
MGGTAVSALTTVRLVDAHGFATPFVIVAIMLASYGVIAVTVLRDAPNRAVPSAPALGRMLGTLRRPITWRASVLYAVGFGGYVAFSVYLPTYLKNAYQLAQSDASNKMAGFVLVAVVFRPLGGWLSDRVQAPRVLMVCFVLVTIGALVQAATPALAPTATVAFLGMAAALGAASGAVFALVARRAPADQVGSVSGIVGAAGGLGGFVPPLLMGSIYGSHGSYAAGLVALAVVALLAFGLSARLWRAQPRSTVEAAT